MKMRGTAGDGRTLKSNEPFYKRLFNHQRLKFLKVFQTYNLYQNYPYGIILHMSIAIIYAIDLIRRHKHPHVWVLNFPIFVYWLFDRFVFRSGEILKTTVDFHAFKISESYFCFFWDEKNCLERDFLTVGRVYNIRNHGNGNQQERAQEAPNMPNPNNNDRFKFLNEPQHPFTSITNRHEGIQAFFKILSARDNIRLVPLVVDGNKNLIKNPDCIYTNVWLRDNRNVKAVTLPVKEAKNHLLGQPHFPLAQIPKNRLFSQNHKIQNWTTAFICQISVANKKAFTNNLGKQGGFLKSKIDIWPKDSVKKLTTAIKGTKDFIVVGSGSGVGMLVDFLSFVMYDCERGRREQQKQQQQRDRDFERQNFIDRDLQKCTKTIIYTTADLNLVNWFLHGCLANTKILTLQNIKILIFLTKGKAANHEAQSINSPESDQIIYPGDRENYKFCKIFLGRMEVDKVFSNFEKQHIYFCGHAGGKLKENIEGFCDKSGFKFQA